MAAIVTWSIMDEFRNNRMDLIKFKVKQSLDTLITKAELAGNKIVGYDSSIIIIKSNNIGIVATSEEEMELLKNTFIFEYINVDRLDLTEVSLRNMDRTGSLFCDCKADSILANWQDIINL